MQYDYVTLTQIAKETQNANANVSYWVNKLQIETKSVAFGEKTMLLIPFEKKQEVVNQLNER